MENYPDRSWRFPELNSIDQIKKITEDLASEPRLSSLALSFFRPADLYDKRRPGYVPCPLVGDFKFRKKQLDFSMMFRSCDCLSFLYFDIVHLRNLQKEVLQRAAAITKNAPLKAGEPGRLNLFFARLFINEEDMAARVNKLLWLREIARSVRAIPIN